MKHTLHWLLILLLLSGSAWAEQNPIRALLVGVGDYKDPGWSPLQGPPSDVQKLKKTLTDRYSAAAITVLPQEQATREGLENALLKLVSEIQPGETVIFYYAGHGCVTLNRQPPEGSRMEKFDPEDDGLDECLVPIDAPSHKDPTFGDKVVRDDFFEEILSQAVKKARPASGPKGSVVFLFDSCHSGTISRSANVLGKIERTNPQARDHAKKIAAAGNNGGGNNLDVTRHAAGKEGWVVLSACQAHQTAKEDPSHGGDFTHALVSGLEDPRLGPNSNYYDLMRLVAATPYFYDQAPLAEGDLELALLGGTASPRQPSIEVLKANQGVVTLNQGQLLGITPGSKIALYKVGTKSPAEKNNLLGVATVASEGTDLYQAVAKVDGGADDKELRSAVGWVQEQNFGQVEVPVFLNPGSESLEGLLDDPVVKKVTRGADAQILAWNDNGKLKLERRSGGLVMQPTSEPSMIRRALKGEARRLYLTRMVNQPQNLTVEMTPGQFQGAGVDSFVADPAKKPGGDGLLAFGKGEQALLTVRNDSSSPLYISVLNFLNDGAVKVLYPYGIEAQKKVAPGQTLRIDLAFDGGQGKEGFKVIGTSKEIDLLFLETNGKERSASDPEATVSGPFGELMAGVMTGTRASRPTIKEPAAYVAKEIVWVNLK